MKYFFLFLIAVFIAGCSGDKKNQETQKRQTNPVFPGHRCLNCGMNTDQWPEWQQMLINTSGDTAFFDGARCMFMVLNDTLKRPDNIDQIIVKEYYDQFYFPADSAYYVIGSDVLGPMGNELIPFKSESAAQTFKTDHKGEDIVRFDDVDLILVKKLAGKMEMK